MAATAHVVPPVELLWALANYFKHREEWEMFDWTEMKGQSRTTAEVILQVGLSASSTGNLRRGAEALGNTTYDRLDVLADIVEEWGRVVLKACQAELS